MSEQQPPEEFRPVIRSEFGRWARTATLGMLLALCVLMLWVGRKVDRNFQGNPNGGSRQVVCAMARGDGMTDPLVRKVVEENCPEP